MPASVHLRKSEYCVAPYTNRVLLRKLWLHARIPRKPSCIHCINQHVFICSILYLSSPTLTMETKLWYLSLQLCVWLCRRDLLVVRFLGYITVSGELSYLGPLGSENFSAPYFKQCFLRGGGYYPQTESNTTPPSPKTEITNTLFYILNFA